MKFSKQRMEVIKNVLFGNESPDLLSDEELDFFENLVHNLVEEKLLTEKAIQGKIVFIGKENALLN